MKEELYIVVSGERRSVELNSPSDITLDYVSKLYSDISKYESSYSYTFNIPITEHNRAVFGMADDIRSVSSLINKTFDAEFYVNGIKMFDNGALYLNGVSSDGAYECVFTWANVKGLKALNDIDISLKELGNHLADYDYEWHNDRTGETEKDRLFFLGDWTDWSDFASNSNCVVGSLHKAGVNPFVKAFFESRRAAIDYIEQLPSEIPYFLGLISPSELPNYKRGGLIKKGILTTEQNGEFTDGTTHGFNIPMYSGGMFSRVDGKYITSAGLPAPIVSVRYILSAIEEAYPGLKIDIDDDLVDELGVPLINMTTSKGVWSRNYITFSLRKPAGVETRMMYFSSITKEASFAFNNIIEHVTVTHREDAYTEYNSVLKVPQAFISKDGKLEGVANSYGTEFYENYIRIRAVIDGYMEITLKGIPVEKEEATEPVIEIQTRKAGNGSSGDNWYTIGTIEGRFITRSGFATTTDELENLPCIYRFECREAEGAENVETDIFYSALDYCYLRFELSDRSDSSGYLEPQSYKGSFNLYLRYDDISDEGRYINIFQNLPDISCLDFLKSLGHITGTYPIMKDGAVKYRRYSEIEDNISSGKIYNWSSYLLSEDTDNHELDFSLASLSESYAQKNYFLMKNDEVSSTGEEKPTELLEDRYKHSYGKILIGNSSLDNVSTFAQLPFYGAFEANGKAPFVNTYNNQSLWTTDNGHQYKLSEAKPVIARIVPQECRAITYQVKVRPWSYSITSESALPDKCSIEVWQFPENMESDERYSLMCKIFKNPKVLSFDAVLPEAVLSNIDMAIPVYIERYNSYFAIYEIEYNTQDGISNVRLLKIPNTN